MSMHLVTNWATILKKAWSVRLMIVVVILSGLEVALPFFQDSLNLTPGVFGGLAGLVSAAAIYARLVAQEDVTPKETNPNADTTPEP